MSIFSKTNSGLHYYNFVYVDLKYLNKYQQCFMNLLTEWCFILNNNIDLICLTETYFDSTVDPNNLLINGYNLLRANHPDNVRRGGSCLYYGENLTLRQVDRHHTDQCIVCEINI